MINVDDPYGARLARDFPSAIRIGLDAPDARCARRRSRATRAGRPSRSTGWRCARRCRAASTSSTRWARSWSRASWGSTTRRSRAAWPRAERVPGRFEPVDEGQPFAVFVDYSHKPDALEAVLRTARGLTRGRLIVVFGAGGDRDRGKRPLMGAAAAEHADVAIITSDNPRSEDPEAIMAEIAEGAARRRAGGRSPRGHRARRRAGARPATSSSSPARATSATRSSRTAARCPSTTWPSPARRCVREWSPERVAQAAGGRLVAPRRAHRRPGARGDRLARGRARRPLRRAASGEHVDGGRFAAQALAGGAWGVLVAPAHAEAARGAGPEP